MGIVILLLFGLLALSFANGCEPSIGADGDRDFDFGLGDDVDGDRDFDFELDDDGVDGGDDLGTCDDVVVVEASTGEGQVQVPADTELLGASESVACEMSVGEGDEDAVIVLQEALERCNGQTVAIDGEYGSRTAAAVMAVQRRAGVAADGWYGPATLQVMRWPATSASGTVDCAPGVSQVPTDDGEISSLPPTL